MTGSQLKRLRTTLGYSQTDMAARLGIHVMTLSRWERGLHRIPQPVVLALRTLKRRRAKRER